jgi:hypothetical protein
LRDPGKFIAEKDTPMPWLPVRIVTEVGNEGMEELEGEGVKTFSNE